MADQIVSGLAELGKFLDQVPANMEKNVLRGALRAGAKVPLASARSNVPVEHGGEHPGALRDSLRIVTSARGGVVKASVKAGGKTAWWARWVEGGTKPHDIHAKREASLFFGGLFKRAVRHPGAKAHPYMAPALANNVTSAVDAVAGYIRKRLTKAGLQVPGPENF